MTDTFWMALPLAAEPMPYDEMELRSTPEGVEILTAPDWIGISTDLLAGDKPEGHPMSVDLDDSGVLLVVLEGVNRTLTYRMVAVVPGPPVVVCQKVSEA